MKGEGEDGGGCGSEEREGVGERPPYHRGGSIWVVPDAWLPGKGVGVRAYGLGDSYPLTSRGPIPCAWGIPSKPPIEPRGCTHGLFSTYPNGQPGASSQGCLSHAGVHAPRAIQGPPSGTCTAHILAGRATARLVAGGIRSRLGGIR